MPDTVKDPVCGMMIDPAKSRHGMLNQHDYCFCSEECRNKFVVNPGDGGLEFPPPSGPDGK